MILVVVPTYNERDNLPLLINHLFSLRVPDMRLLIVDDNSPDGTARVAEELASRYPITVLNRAKKEGLGRAYCDAFRYALSAFPDASHIIQMDADFSHDPTDIPRLLEIAQKADVVLGSRYISGGSIANWHWLRKMISQLGNEYARWMLWLPYRDLTSGFKCWRRETLAALDLEKISSLGYNFQIEMTWQAHKKRFRIQEAPIVFTERKIGSSKFNIGIIAESFLNVLLMRFK